MKLTILDIFPLSYDFNVQLLHKHLVKIGRVVGEKKTQDDRRRQTITIPIGQQLKVSQVILKKVMV